ncbi:MAG TPA: transposase [Anaerolineaceae bacterium]
MEGTMDANNFQMMDEVWEKIQPLLPSKKRRKTRRGRPRMNDRAAMEAVWYKLQTGCPWKELPRELGAGSTIHDRYQEWRMAGVFKKLQRAGILTLDPKANRR